VLRADSNRQKSGGVRSYWISFSGGCSARESPSTCGEISRRNTRPLSPHNGSRCRVSGRNPKRSSLSRTRCLPILTEKSANPLWARCLVLKSGSETVALVSCDLLGLTRYHTEKIRAGIVRVPREKVLIGCTHTHSGPDTYGQWGPTPTTSGVDTDWLRSTYG